MDPIEAKRKKLEQQLALRRARGSGATTAPDLDPDELSRFDELEVLEESRLAEGQALDDDISEADLEGLDDIDLDDVDLDDDDLDDEIDLDDDDLDDADLGDEIDAIDLDDESLDDDLSDLDDDVSDLHADTALGISDADLEGLAAGPSTESAEDLAAAVARDMLEQNAWGETIDPAAEPTADAEPESSADGETRECPMCAETVRARARICRYCRYDLIQEALPALQERLEQNLELAWKRGGWDMVAVHELRKVSDPLAAAGETTTPRRALDLLCNLSEQLSSPQAERKPAVMKALLTALEETLETTDVDAAPLKALADAIRSS